MAALNLTTPKDINYLILPDGAKLAYVIYGQEHLDTSQKKVLPLVLIGGIGSTEVDWEVLLPHLSKKRTVLTFDFRGIGLSTYSTPANNDKLTIESMAQDVMSLIQNLDWRDIDILGYSMGGVLLQHLLLHHQSEANLPFRVHHALLTATLASPVVGGYPGLKPFPISKYVTEDEKKEHFKELMKVGFSPEWIALPNNRGRYDVWLENCLVNRPFETIMKQRKMLAKFSFTHNLKHINPRTKLLVLHGTADLTVPFTSAEEILRACPHARLVSIGSKRGQVPSYAFGHIWYEHFDVQVWIGVIESFLDDEGCECRVGARL